MRLSEFASLDGVLFRVTEASDPKEGYDSARCYVLVALRKQVIRTMHSSAFGAHRDETATHKELVVRYYWPRMDFGVHEFVRECVDCGLVKGTNPSRQGFLRDWRHNTAMNMIRMDLIGQIGHAPVTSPVNKGIQLRLRHLNRVLLRSALASTRLLGCPALSTQR